MEFELKRPELAEETTGPIHTVREQAIRELTEIRKKAARKALTKVAPEIIVSPQKGIEASEPVELPEISVSVEAVDTEEELNNEDGFPIYDYQIDHLGTGRQCKVSRLKSPTTGESLLYFEALPGAEAKLAVHAEILRELMHENNFLKVRHYSAGAGSEPAFMICEDPGTEPLTDKLRDLNLDQRMDLVRQLINAFQTLHDRARKLHTDPFPKQIYVVQKDSEVRSSHFAL